MLKTVKLSKQPKTERTPIDFYFSVDCSGSMYNEISKIREFLKANLVNLLNEEDTLTLITFSSNNDIEVVLDHLSVKGLKELKLINQSLDKLQTRGLTGFYHPLELIDKLIKTDSRHKAVLKLTDGHENQNTKQKVLDIVDKLSQKLNNFTIVEYGDYCNHNYLIEMTKVASKSTISHLLYSDLFNDFIPLFTDFIKQNAKEISYENVMINETPLYGFGFSNETRFELVKGENKIISSLEQFHYFTEEEVENIDKDALYYAAYHLAQTLNYDKVYQVLSKTRDIKLFNEAVNAVGIQKMIKFEKLLLDTAKDNTLRGLDGLSDNLSINHSAYCLFNLLDDLVDDNATFNPFDKFTYRRVGAKSVVKQEKLDNSVITEIVENINSGKATKDELLEYINKVSSKEVSYEVTNKKDQTFNNLVWNETELNLSVSTVYPIKLKLPKNNFNIEEFDSSIFRTYTFIHNGRYNVSSLEIKMSEKLFNKLRQEKLIDDKEYQGKHLVHISRLPIVNRTMVNKDYSAIEFATMKYRLLELQAAYKVYNKLQKDLFGKTDKSFVEIYGQEVADYLKELGITSGGYAPKTEKQYSGDFIVIDTLDCNFITGYTKKGDPKYLSLPSSINDILEKVVNKESLTDNQKLFEDSIIQYLGFKSLGKTDKEIEVFLADKKEENFKESRKLIKQIAQTLFSLSFSQKWFKEFKDFSENKGKINYKNREIEFAIVSETVEEKI